MLTRRVNFSLFLASILVLLCFNAHAYQVNIIAEGIVIDNATDSLGWGGDAFTFQMMIDSTKAPDDNLSSMSAITSFYTPDAMSLHVGGVDVSSRIGFDLLSVPEIQLGKASDPTSADLLDLRPQSDEGWFMEVVALFPHCYLGDYSLPLSIPESITPGDEVLFAGGIYDYGQDEIMYDLSVQSVRSSAVPEPTTMLLFGAGLLGLAGFGRKKFKK